MSNQDNDPFFIPGQTFAQWQERRPYYPDQIDGIVVIDPDNSSAHESGYTVVHFLNGKLFCSICGE